MWLQSRGCSWVPCSACGRPFQGQAQLPDVPRELLPSRRKFGADFYVTDPRHFPNHSGKCVNKKNESTGTHPQCLPRWKMEMLCLSFSFFWVGKPRATSRKATNNHSKSNFISRTCLRSDQREMLFSALCAWQTMAPH